MTDPSRHPGVVLCVVMLACLIPGLGGCRSSFLSENDRLRRQNMALQDELGQLRTRVRTLEARCQPPASQPAATLPAGVDWPECAAIVIGRLSGGMDENGDGRDDTLRLYMQTLDSRRRFVPVVGTVAVTIAAIADGRPAATVETRHWTIRQLDEAYRAGLTGTHYTLICPLPSVDATSVRVALTFYDARTGRLFKTDKTIAWH